MNSIAHPGYSVGETSASKIRRHSRLRIGRTRFPPANTEYRMAVWMEEGCADSAGNSFSSCASTASRSSSKKGGSFIGLREVPVCAIGSRSRFVLAFGFKRFGGHLSIGLLKQNFHAPFGFFQLFLAFARKPDALFKQFHRFIQRELRAFQAAHHFLQPRQRAFKIRFFLRFRFLCNRLIHAIRQSCSN